MLRIKIVFPSPNAKSLSSLFQHKLRIGKGDFTATSSPSCAINGKQKRENKIEPNKIFFTTNIIILISNNSKKIGKEPLPWAQPASRLRQSVFATPIPTGRKLSPMAPRNAPEFSQQLFYGISIIPDWETMCKSSTRCVTVRHPPSQNTRTEIFH